ncbi:hypothetical protein [Lentzea sp. NPDC060358]|uniref:hypothetical protein n=1 Tax=Lentzea sp. NPDC060358 TaxID=3347103 RepID=UPI0036629141
MFALVATIVFPTILPDASTAGDLRALPDVTTLAVWIVRHVSLFALGWAARPLITQVAAQVRLIASATLIKIRRRVARWLLQDVQGS